MTNFTPLGGFDATQVDPNFTGGGFFPVSDAKGWLVQLIRDEGFKPSKSGEGQYLALVVAGIDGPVAGQEAIIRLNLQHTKQGAIAAAQAQLSALCHVTGVHKPGSTADLMGKPFRVVSVEQTQTEADKAAGKTPFTQLADNGIRDANGNRPGQNASGAQQAAQQPTGQAPVNPAIQQQQQQPAQDPNAGQAAFGGSAQQPAQGGGGAPGWGQQPAQQQGGAPGWGQQQQQGGGGAPGWAQG